MATSMYISSQVQIGPRNTDHLYMLAQ